MRTPLNTNVVHFVNEDLLKNSAIDVDTKDHVVTLSGTRARSEYRQRY
jgi:hypothetical protein